MESYSKCQQLPYFGTKQVVHANTPRIYAAGLLLEQKFINCSGACFRIVVVVHIRVANQRFVNFVLVLLRHLSLDHKTVDVRSQIVGLQKARAWHDSLASIECDLGVSVIDLEFLGIAVKVDMEGSSSIDFRTVSSGDCWHLLDTSTHRHRWIVNHILHIPTSIHVIVERDVEEIVHGILGTHRIGIIGPSKTMTVHVAFVCVFVAHKVGFLDVAKVTVVGWISVLTIVVRTVAVVVIGLAISSKAAHDTLVLAFSNSSE